MKTVFTVVCLCAVAVLASGAWAEDPAWVAEMRGVASRFNGTSGTIAQFGDSITENSQFFTPLQNYHSGGGAEADAAQAWLGGYINPACWGWKGWYYGNYSGTIIDQALDSYSPGGVTGNIDLWLDRLDPEMAVIMWGTNDAYCEINYDGGPGRPIFEADLTTLVRKCKANGTIPVLTTIPPMCVEAQQWQWDGENVPNDDWRVVFIDWLDAIRRVAEKENVPLIEYYEAIVERRPNDPTDPLQRTGEWNGTLMQYNDRHPSNSGHGSFSEATLDNHGYVLRNYATLLKLYDVNNEVLTEAPIFEGDSDADGDVDANDLATLGLNWSPAGTAGQWIEGDFNGDGDVDAVDLAQLASYWSPGGYAAPVPEPASLSLLGLAGLGLLRRRRN